MLRKLVVVFAFVFLVLTPVFAQEDAEIFDNDNTVAEMDLSGANDVAAQEPMDISGKEAEVDVDNVELDMNELNYDGEGELEAEENIDDILNAELEDEEEMEEDAGMRSESDDEGDEGFDLNMKALRLTPHPLTDIPSPSDEIEVSYKFMDDKIALGDPVRVVLNMKNKGMSVYNVTECLGSLNDVRKFGVYYQNFTERNFNATLYPGYELNFLYVFGVYPSLDPRDYQLALTVFYETDTEFFATTFVNETRRVVDEESIWDIRTLSIVAFFAGAGYLGMLYFNRNKAPKKTAKKTDSSEWLEPEKVAKKDAKKDAKKKKE